MDAYARFFYRPQKALANVHFLRASKSGQHEAGQHLRACTRLQHNLPIKVVIDSPVGPIVMLLLLVSISYNVCYA